MSNKENNVVDMQGAATKAAQQVTNEKPYTLRRLNDEDMWPVLDIIGKVFPDDVSKLIAATMLDVSEGSTTDKDKLNKAVSKVGADVLVKLVVAVLKNMKLVKDDVYTLLSGVSGIPVEDMKKMPFGTTPMMIWDIVKNESNADFFTAVSKLL